MLISYCSGSTSLAFLRRCSSSCFARASSRWVTTSSPASAAASSMSSGHPVWARFSVIWRATVRSSQTRSAGRHSSCLSVIHKKSSKSRSLLPGESRVPRPTIWLYRLRTLVGRSTTTQSTEGQSQPSVSSMELHSTLYLPASKSASTCLRSSLWPLTSAARKPWAFSRSRNFWLVLISGRNTTVLRSLQRWAISAAICSRYGSSAVPRSPTA